MSKTFRPWTIDQPLLLPPSVQDFVGDDHLARFVLALVLEHLDLGEIEAAYASERGQPPFDPAMMTGLLLYAYCNGVYSSRRIAKAAAERVDFMSIVGLDPPDFRTVSDFSKRHLKALAGLFGQVLRLCEQAGLAKLGHVAARRDEDQGERLQAQGDELRANGQARGGARGRGRELAERRRGCGRRGGQGLRPRQERRGAAQVGRRQEEARGEDPGGEGRIGGRGESGRGGQGRGRGRGRRTAK